MVRAESAQRSFLQTYKRPLAVLGFWLMLFSSVQAYAWYNDTTFIEVVQWLGTFSANSRYGPFIFLIIAAICPLIFFPAALLGIGAGYVFGPVWGTLYTLVCCNISATVAYSVGRCLREDIDNWPRLSRLMRHYGAWLRCNDMSAILMMRFAFLPYDMVNYMVGIFHMRWGRFILANTIGCLPGALALVLFGASVDHFEGILPHFDPWVLAASSAFIVVSATLAWVFRCRDCASADDEPVA